MFLSKKSTRNSFVSVSASNLIKDPTCNKNPNNPSCINLILTNRARSFQHSCVIETSLSDFPRITFTILKMEYRKLEPKVVYCSDYKNFSHDIFLKSLKNNLPKYSFSPFDNDCDDLCQICTKTLSK